MKIAVYHNLPSGGAKRSLFEILKRLSQKYMVDVFSLSTADHEFGGLDQYANHHNIYEINHLPLLTSPFGRVNQLIRIENLRRVRAMTRHIANQIDRGGYDVAFVQPCRFEGSPSILRYLQSTPSVYYCHEPLRWLYEKRVHRPYERMDNYFRRMINTIDPLLIWYRRFLKQTDFMNLHSAGRVLVNSKFTQANVSSLYHIHAHVSYLGVDAELFRPTGAPKLPRLISVGSMTPLKGFDFLIRSLARVPKTRRLPLQIVSNFENPPERNYIKNLAGSYDVEIELSTNVDDEELVRFYNQSLLTLYAPISEPFGLVPLESMGCGTPVLGVNEGGIRETIRHCQVGLLEERDELSFAEAIQNLLSNQVRLDRYSKNARNYVLNTWTWEQAVQDLEVALWEGSSPYTSSARK